MTSWVCCSVSNPKLNREAYNNNTWNAWILADCPWYHIGVRIGAYLIILNSEMNSHWPYNICVILLRSMQTFAGLRDSSLSDPCLSATHYGTTKVTINCQCTEKLNTTLSVEKRSDRHLTLVLMSTMTIGRLCRQSLGRLYGLSLPSYHGQSVWI